MGIKVCSEYLLPDLIWRTYVCSTMGYNITLWMIQFRVTQGGFTYEKVKLH